MREILDVKRDRNALPAIGDCDKALLMDPHDKLAGELAGELFQAEDALRDFYRRSHRLIDRAMAAQGASFARTRVLMAITRQGALRSTDLAASFGRAPRTITEAIDGLERDGLVRRDPDPDDRRAKRISPTPAGIAAVAGSEASRIRHVESVFGVLSQDERAAIVTIMSKLNKRLQELGG